MSAAYIGSSISLISVGLIRYEGVLLQIDPKTSTLTLSNGTSYARFEHASAKTTKLMWQNRA